MVVACLALAVALGGTGIAANIALAPNSVGTVQLKNNAVTGAKVANGALTKADFKAGQLPAGATGAAGPAGQTGTAGAKGDPGTNGTNGTKGMNGATSVVVRSQYIPNGFGYVYCKAGESVTGGGMFADFVVGAFAAQSSPTPGTGTPTGWGGRFLLPDGAAASGTAYVVCASP